MNIKIIIPALNPDEKLLEITNELIKNKLDNIVVIDDGSSKEFKSVFNKLDKRIKVIHHKTNFGKGESLKSGIKTLKDEDAFITMDSDGQHKVSDVIKIKECLKKNDIVFGSRNFKQKNVPFQSRFGNKFSSIMCRIKTGKKITDTQTGLRGINIKYKELALNTSGSRYEYEMNFIYNLSKNNIDIKCIDIDTIYENNNDCSHFRPIKDSFIIYKSFFIGLILLLVAIILLILL